MNIYLVGNGKMGIAFKNCYGQEIIYNTNNIPDDLNLSNAQVIIDFSHPDNLDKLLKIAYFYHLPLVIGTTNYSNSQINEIINYSQYIPICFSSNYSLEYVKTKHAIKEFINDETQKIIIIDTHHISKKDSPSGTAKELRSFINNLKPELKVQIKSIRRGTTVGIHRIIIVNKDDTIEVSFAINNRNVFVKGAYCAAKKILNKKNGLYSFETLLEENNDKA